VYDTNVQPEEVVGEFDDAVDAEAFTAGRAVGNDGSRSLLAQGASGRVIMSSSVAHSSDEVSSISSQGRGAVFGEEDAGACVAIQTTHHFVGGGVVIDFGASFAAKGSIDFVDAFVGSVTEGETGRTRDAVTSIREEDLGGRVTG